MAIIIDIGPKIEVLCWTILIAIVLYKIIFGRS